MNAYLPGRFQIIRNFILDIAHNLQAIKALTENLNYLFPREDFIFIIGILKDKDIDGMVEELSKINHKLFIIVEPKTDRAASTTMISNYLSKYTDRIEEFSTVSAGINFVQKFNNKNNKNKICITGSHYTVAEALKYLS